MALPLPPVFGLFRPAHGPAKYLIIIKLTEKYSDELKLTWQIADFEENPGRFFEIQATPQINKYFGIVKWSGTSANPSTIRSWSRGQHFMNLPFRVQYKSSYIPILYSFHGGWIPARAPRLASRPLEEGYSEYVTNIINRQMDILYPETMTSHTTIDTTEVIVNATVNATAILKENVATISPQIPKYVYENHVMAEKSKGTDCPISMTPLSELKSVTVVNCFHIFDSDSLSSWIKTNNNCPICRNKIISTIVI